MQKQKLSYFTFKFLVSYHVPSNRLRGPVQVRKTMGGRGVLGLKRGVQT
jgi:hypothetical protein